MKVLIQHKIIKMQNIAVGKILCEIVFNTKLWNETIYFKELSFETD